ncbi:MAG: putative NAD(P)H-dependent FMN-containing oxidoreductase YwqN [Synergistetes bacterium ADurb.Bin155]|jgi:multimeric flavodoxin WrbA|nr:flavodoxin family protein [Synergistales bacterium]NMD18418.1 flavodoxin family protein [Synergistaceae bacterium]OQB46264.1 MAG: putative NAD(P)H-dependent FMN-containing oxidoreductase YwqN [Synergistetes bacterium ADurb.Bin155]MBP8995959.1 flavodoxin family protein [Synergistales bacterium]HOC82866.1 flavodoxin family protein [Synergistales bacterium]
MKRILGILGSPRRGGNSETLARKVLEGAAENGWVTDVIRLQDLEINGCTDCRRCWSGGSPCVIDDDMDKVYEKIREADLLVFASPLYWYSWSSQIKPVWDRSLPFVHKEARWDLKDKKALLVAAAGDDKPEAFEGMLFSFRTSCRLLGMEMVEPLLAHGVHGMAEAEKSHWFRLAGELGRSL